MKSRRTTPPAAKFRSPSNLSENGTTPTSNIPAPRQGQAGQRRDGKPRHFIRDKVLMAIERAKGEIVYRDTIASDLDSPPSSVANAVSGLMKTVPQIVPVVAGRSWRWSEVTTKEASNPQSDRRMFEEVGESKTGAIVIQDEEGRLYRAEEI